MKTKLLLSFVLLTIFSNLVKSQCVTLSYTSTSSYCSSGTITITASGGVTPYTYMWSPTGGTNAIASGLSAGTYTITVFDNTGCSNMDTIFLSSGAITFSASGSPAGIIAGDSALLAAFCNIPGTYSWAPPLSVTNPDSSETYAHPLVNTEYTVTIITACGTFIDSVLINLNCFNIGITSTSSYCSSGVVSATVSGGTPPYTYNWSPVGGTTATVSGLSAGTYTVTVLDNTGCSSMDTAVVSNSALSYSTTGSPSVITAGDSALLSANCSIPGTYSWTPSFSVTNPDSAVSYAHPAATTLYTVTITTACGTFTDSVLITVNCFGLNMSSTATCTSSSDGTATVSASGGTPPFTYLWAPGGQTSATASGLSAGNYTVTVYDNTGCSVTGAVSVSSFSESFSVSGNPATIIAGDSALLSATSTLAATYSWAPSASVNYPDSSSTYAHPATTTVYTLTIITACGTYTDPVTITVDCFPVSISSTPTCSSSFDGTATIITSGGTPPFTYSWSAAGQTTATATGLGATVYSVTVYDATGCSSVATVSVSSYSELYSISGNPATIIAGDSTRLTLISNLAATYSWAPSASVTYPDSASSNATPVTTTEYTVTITTACGTFTDSVLITVNCFYVGLTSTSSSCASGTVSANCSGGTAPYTYSWAPGGQTTSAISGLTAGIYSVTVYDATGCSVTAASPYLSDSIFYSASANPTILSPGDSSLLAATCTTSPATYSWAPPASVTYPDSASSYAHPTATTEYTVTIITPCGTFTDSVLVSVNCFSLSMSSTPSVYCSSYDGSAMVTASGGTPPYTYSWSPGGQTTDSISGLYQDNYSVTVYDATGCSSIGIVSVSSAAVSFYITASPDTVVTFGDSVILNAVCNTSATYLWASGATNSSITVTPVVTTTYICQATTLCGTFTDTITVYVTNCANAYNQPLCVVTIDTATNLCEIIWGRTNSPPSGGYGDFYIYRDSASFTYNLIHTQPLNALSDYIDPASTPSAGPVSYELATFDSCGLSARSAPHTSIYLITTSGVNVYILNWTAYIGFTPTLYRIFRGPSMTTLVQIDSVSNTTLSFHDTLPPAGSFYAVEAVSPTGVCIPTTHSHIRPGTELSGSFSNGFNTAVLGIKPITGSIANLNIYPNPSNGQFTIQWSVVSNQLSEVKISVIDELGQVVYAENKNTHIGLNTEQLNLENLASGVYTLRMQTNDGITVKKVVVMKK